MTLCCLHPSPWSHAIGNALLDGGDEAFVESWADLLSASAMAGSMEVDVAGDAQDADMSEAQEPEENLADVESHHEPEPEPEPESVADLAPWREALKAPRVPIGVV